MGIDWEWCLMMFNDGWNTYLECLLSACPKVYAVHHGGPAMRCHCSIETAAVSWCPPYYAYLIISSFLQSRCVFIIYTRLINSDLKMWVPPDSAWDKTTHKSWGFPPLSVFLRSSLSRSWYVLIINPYFLLLHGAFRVWLGGTGMHVNQWLQHRWAAGLSVSHATSREPCKRSALENQQGVSRTGSPNNVQTNHQKSWDWLIFGDLDRLGMELYYSCLLVLVLVADCWDYQVWWAVKCRVSRGTPRDIFRMVGTSETTNCNYVIVLKIATCCWEKCWLYNKMLVMVISINN